MFDVPTFLAPGNHDGYWRLREDGLNYWEEYFGPVYYSFDYGPHHFTSVNSYDWWKFQRFSFLFVALNWGGSIRQRQLQWIEDDLSSTDADLKFIFLHHNPIWETTNHSLLRNPYKNRLPFLELIDTHDVDMVLAGHEHIDDVTIENDTIFITTTTPESEIRVDDGYWGYRLVTIENGSITSYNYQEPKYSIPSYPVSYTHLRAHET